MTDETPDQKPADDKPRFVGGKKPLLKAVELDFFVEFRGKTYERLMVKRLSVSEVSAWLDKVNGGDKDATLGNVVDEDGNPVPAEVLEFLEDDDDAKLSEVLDDFLPRRLSELLKSGSST